MPPADYYHEHKERVRAYNRAWYAANKDKARAHAKAFRQRHPEKKSAYKKKAREMRDNETPREWQRRTFNMRKRPAGRHQLKPEHLAWPTHCPVLGWELDYTGTDPQRGWSIDKFDPALGYVPGNVTIISRLANTIKSNATIEQVEQVAAWMRKKRATL